jgi:nucleoside 2-deoxyribosyltransferase
MHVFEEDLKMRVYLCGPMAGCSDKEAGGWRKAATTHLNQFGIVTLDPMDRDYRDRDYGEDPESVLPDLVEEDKIDIEMSDVVLVNFTKPSTGTAMEIILAWQKQKRVIVVAPPDLQLSPWVHYHCHKLFHNMHEAYDHIVSFNNRIRK